MLQDNKILLAKGENEIHLLLDKANRHGVITGATGTGKTITLKVLAESFSDAGVPVFLADIKGDLSGMCKKGEMNENIEGRLAKMGIENFEFEKYINENENTELFQYIKTFLPEKFKNTGEIIFNTLAKRILLNIKCLIFKY